MNLVEFFELYGLVSGKDLTDYFGEKLDVVEFKRMLNDCEISEHREPLGRKMYRYPYLDVESKAEGPQRVLDVVIGKPGINAKSIREILRISQRTFEKWEDELLERKQLVRVKEGTSWTYFSELGEEKSESQVPEEAFGLFLAFVEGELNLDSSIQSMAKEIETSRISARNARNWLVDKGLVTPSGHTFPKTVEERKEYLKRHFPKITEIQLRNLSRR